MRCLRFEGRSDGYPTREKKLLFRHDHDRNNSSTASGKFLPILQKTNANFIRSFDASVEFRNEDEHLSFLAFQYTTKDASCPYYTTSSFTLWDTVLQGCRKDDFIRDAVIAVGALITNNRKLIKDRDDRLTRAPYEYSPRYQFALKQYGRAVKKMRMEV